MLELRKVHWGLVVSWRLIVGAYEVAFGTGGELGVNCWSIVRCIGAWW